jgi:hypothetical protein
MENRSLRSRTIRLAHTNAELRPHLLPLLSKQASNKFPIRGLAPVLKGWALGEVKRWVAEVNQETDDEPISINDLDVTHIRDGGSWIVYEVQDNEGVVINLTLDMKAGEIEIEFR